MNMQSTMLQVESVSCNALLNEVSKLLDIKLSILTTSKVTNEDTYITRQQVAEMYSITLPTVHSWMNVGILKSYKIGNKTRFLLSEVKAAAKSTKQKEVQND